jgi:RimJ/RimL family protein N-acetyltransferase
MELRAFRSEDAAVICRWIRTERELYQWSADRFCKFPLSAEDIAGSYAQQTGSGRFFPFTATDGKGSVTGHFIIRYPRADDDSLVRFGFVIVDPALRGSGLGRTMLAHGIAYVRAQLPAKTVDLGVFANNPSAKRCYEAVGFREYARRSCELPVGCWECIDMKLTLGESCGTGEGL